MKGSRLRRYGKFEALFCVKLIRYQFWCTRCAFRLIKSLQWYSGRKSWKSEKTKLWKLYKSKKKKTQKNCAMKLSQICHFKSGSQSCKYYKLTIISHMNNISLVSYTLLQLHSIDLVTIYPNEIASTRGIPKPNCRG
jgi:hypothetical protein